MLTAPQIYLAVEEFDDTKTQLFSQYDNGYINEKELYNRITALTAELLTKLTNSHSTTTTTIKGPPTP